MFVEEFCLCANVKASVNRIGNTKPIAEVRPERRGA
jgi:hypothetical protein